ncbi:hypothetical protein MKEN_00386400 [Mycena kentingensis (nom. inval.)]|nr:hypothetical protein MKEN_00386400 [Mycena kentingensis (nom. inval.)]
MALARPSRPHDRSGLLTCPELAISLRQPQSMAAPGRTLQSFYQLTGNLLERSANRMAHRLGRGPVAVEERIQNLLKQESSLQSLRSGQAVPRKLRKQCTDLMRFASPSEGACTQMDCFKAVLGRRESLTRDTILSLWHRSDAFGSLDDFTFASTFAAECITESCISPIVETGTDQPLWLVDPATAQTDFAVVERLTIACGCVGTSEYSPRLAVRYLAGIVNSLSFWRQEGCVFQTAALKILQQSINLLRDLGVDEPSHGDVHQLPTFRDDAEGVDLLCHAVIAGILDRRALGRSIKVWEEEITVMIVLLRNPRSADILPLSWEVANRSEVHDFVPGFFAFRSVETLLLEESSSSRSPRVRRILNMLRPRRASGQVTPLARFGASGIL